jgi:hypothetical protein
LKKFNKLPFLSRKKLYDAVKDEYSGIKYKDIDKFLSNNETKQVLTQTRKPTVYNTINAVCPYHSLQADIIIYDRYEYHKYKYILNIIDVHSRYLWSFP